MQLRFLKVKSLLNNAFKSPSTKSQNGAWLQEFRVKQYTKVPII